MTDRQWVQIVSWHAVRNFTRAGGAITMCGRFVIAGKTTDQLGSEKSCESCLRLIARAEDV